jgi:plastocyanin
MRGGLQWTLPALVLAALLPAGAAAETHTVRIEGMQFQPATLTVRKGDRIVWRNQDMVLHTATAAGAFDTGVIPAGGSATRKLDKAGHFAYICTLHPAMKGEVVVQ